MKNTLAYQSAVLPRGPACPLCHIARYCSVAATIGGFGELPVPSRAVGADMKRLLFNGVFAESLMRSSGPRPQKHKAWGAVCCLPGVIRIINAWVAMGLLGAGEMLSLPIPGTAGRTALTEHRYSRLRLKSFCPLSLLRCTTKKEMCGRINFLHPFRLH